MLHVRRYSKTLTQVGFFLLTKAYVKTMLSVDMKLQELMNFLKRMKTEIFMGFLYQVIDILKFSLQSNSQTWEKGKVFCDFHIVIVIF